MSSFVHVFLAMRLISGFGHCIAISINEGFCLF